MCSFKWKDLTSGELCIFTFSIQSSNFMYTATLVSYPWFLLKGFQNSPTLRSSQSNFCMTLKWKCEQDRNNKWTEIEWFYWLFEQIQRRVAFGWLSKRSAEKISCWENFLEINWYFALTLYCNTIGQSDNAFSMLGFSLVGRRRVHSRSHENCSNVRVWEWRWVLKYIWAPIYTQTKTHTINLPLWRVGITGK